MENPICRELQENYARAFRVLEGTIDKFSSEQWSQGISSFQVPSKVAYHIVDCLDFYFWDGDREYTWGHRFDGGWWEKPDPEQPTQDELLAYLHEIKARALQYFEASRDQDMLAADPEHCPHGETRLGHYIYALRHTMHHHGALTLLTIQHGISGGCWE